MINPKYLPKLSTRTQAFSELTLAGALWGFGFVATIWALPALHPAAIVLYRFLGASAVGILILVARKKPWPGLRAEAKLALIPAFFLWSSLVLQTWGLLTTTATNSAFITSLYVVFIPLFRVLTHREKLHWPYLVCLALALVGTALIVQIQLLAAMKWGDLITLICAFFAAIHILLIDRRAKVSADPFAFNVFQGLWIWMLCLPFVFFTDRWNVGELNSYGWWGLASLALGSSLVAFYLQVRSQKKLPPTVASLLFLMESPFSCLFAYFLIGDRLSPTQWLGALLILISCVGVSCQKQN